MTKTQTNSNLPPKISMFDKKSQANLSRFTRLPSVPNNQSKVVLPTVRINQHKGA